ncbi:pyocin S6 family toxin immunity protein [Pseudomonas putida]|uniref:pyocin S6 family toxin immunity protein n=1 Tax=Pseudomonas putida TaxID=303 RepID=UPI002363ADBA|nr:pyocin S6 family toxin immunity protein [Pseudomonas putida]MDD2060540.1 pyocin S6 family toxin immunity protein [Pseudomonas putida]
MHGAPEGSDEAVFETKLSTLTIEMLMPIMGWQTETDAMASYLLTAEQAIDIERLVGFTLPKGLELYLSCYA